MDNETLMLLLGFVAYLLVGQAYFSKGGTTLSEGLKEAIEEDPKVREAHDISPRGLYLVIALVHVVYLTFWPLFLLGDIYVWAKDKAFDLRHRKCGPYCGECEPCGEDCPTCKV